MQFANATTNYRAGTFTSYFFGNITLGKSLVQRYLNMKHFIGFLYILHLHFAPLLLKHSRYTYIVFYIKISLFSFKARLKSKNERKIN